MFSCEFCLVDLIDHDHMFHHLFDHLNRIESAMSSFANDQEHLAADITAIGEQFATAISELKAQLAQNVPLDFTAADALVASVTAEATADAPPARPADPNAPVDPNAPTA